MKNKTKQSIKNIALTGLAGLVMSTGLALTGCSCVDKDTKIAREQHSDLYREYKNLNMRNLNSEEREILDNAKKTYGKPSVPVSELRKEDPDFIPYMDAINEIEAITGKKEFGEKELILLYRQVRDYIGYPMFF